MTKDELTYAFYVCPYCSQPTLWNMQDGTLLCQTCGGIVEAEDMVFLEPA